MDWLAQQLMGWPMIGQLAVCLVVLVPVCATGAWVYLWALDTLHRWFQGVIRRGDRLD